MSRAVTRIWSAQDYTTSTSISSAVTSPTKWDLIVAVIYIKSVTAEVTAVDLGTGTWARVRREVGSVGALEVWVGYNFDGIEVDTTLSIWLSASASFVHRTSAYRNGAVQSVAPTVSGAVGAVGETGSMLAADVTPTADDETQLVLVAHGAGTSGTPVLTHTPGGVEAFQIGQYSNGTVTAHVGHHTRAAVSLSAHNVSGAVTVPWVAINALITPTAPVANPNTHVYKGRAKRSLDTVGAA